MRSTRPASSFTQTEPKPTPSRTGLPPTCSRATMRPVRGSIRSTFAESMTATQIEPWENTSPTGCGSYTLDVTLCVRASIWATTSAPPPPADQTPSRSANMYPPGVYGSFTVATTRIDLGSTRTSSFAFGTATQTAPAATVTPMCSEQQAAFGPTRTVATTRFVAGSILATAGPPAMATQTAPGETAMPAGWGPTWMVAACLFVAGSMRTTMSFDGSESQT